jgi:hypothetical protein
MNLNKSITERTNINEKPREKEINRFTLHSRAFCSSHSECRNQPGKSSYHSQHQLVQIYHCIPAASPLSTAFLRHCHHSADYPPNLQPARLGRRCLGARALGPLRPARPRHHNQQRRHENYNLLPTRRKRAPPKNDPQDLHYDPPRARQPRHRGEALMDQIWSREGQTQGPSTGHHQYRREPAVPAQRELESCPGRGGEEWCQRNE